MLEERMRDIFFCCSMVFCNEKIDGSFYAFLLLATITLSF
jgi:hypothetical protein